MTGQGSTSANAEQSASWDGSAGEHRVRFADVFDAEVRRHNERFRAAMMIGPRDRVLDIACGTGESTRDAAALATGGSVLGVDLSARMLELAQRRSLTQGLLNISFLQADAQTHPFPTNEFDVCISRFGTMFFADPVAAFANIGRALRPRARLSLMVWQGRDRNEWATLARDAFGAEHEAAWVDLPHSQGDPGATTTVLTKAGFSGIGFTDVHEPVRYGRDADVAYEFVLGLRATRDLVGRVTPEVAEVAKRQLRRILLEHETTDGVLFDSRAWIITATRN